ncbi:HAD family hydrolase [Bacteroidota bacterium]
MNGFTVIFDMDGVILDSERVYQEIERSMYDELGAPVSREEHRMYMGTAEWSMWKTITEKYNVGRSAEELVREERERFMARLEKPGIPLMEGLIPLLEALKSEHIPCWIASSSSAAIIARVMEINVLEVYFKGYVSGDDVKQSKPSPEIFLKAASLAATLPSKCIVIEDSVNGIRAARAAGMAVVALQHPDSDILDSAGASTVVSSLSDFNPAGLIP